MKSKLILIVIVLLMASNLEAIPTKLNSPLMRDWLIYKQNGEPYLVRGKLIATTLFKRVKIKTKWGMYLNVNYKGLSDRDKHYLDTLRKPMKVRK